MLKAHLIPQEQQITHLCDLFLFKHQFLLTTSVSKLHVMLLFLRETKSFGNVRGFIYYIDETMAKK